MLQIKGWEVSKGEGAKVSKEPKEMEVEYATSGFLYIASSAPPLSIFRAALSLASKHPTLPSNAYIKSAIIPQLDELLHCGVCLLIPLEATSPGDWSLYLEG
jgi:hypothetical protein